MLRLLSSRMPLRLATLCPVAQLGCRTAFSTLNEQGQLVRPLPFVGTTVSKTLELNTLMFEIQQMRIIPPSVAERLQELQQPEEWKADSVLRKRRLKMKKHKLRKRRKAQRALRTKLKKD